MQRTQRNQRFQRRRPFKKDEAPKDPEEAKRKRDLLEKEASLDTWNPKTSIGRQVKAREITDIDYILDQGKTMLEAEITDTLLLTESELLLIGQSRGKFGGGQRRVFRQTQKKTREGNKPKFTTISVVGDKNGHVGIGLGKAKETVPAREKAVRKAKLNVFKIRRACGSWQCGCGEPHTIPFAVTGKCGSVIITLMPAPKGKGLCVHSEIAKILRLAGIQDVWSKTRGQAKNRVNLVYACEKALKQLSIIKVQPRLENEMNIVDGSYEAKKPKEEEKENGSKKDETGKGSKAKADSKKASK
ncbi:MAG: 30S ribosomal protein S5 [archaeon]